jgi:hypothetical protein
MRDLSRGVRPAQPRSNRQIRVQSTKGGDPADQLPDRRALNNKFNQERAEVPQLCVARLAHLQRVIALNGIVPQKAVRKVRRKDRTESSLKQFWREKLIRRRKTGKIERKTPTEKVRLPVHKIVQRKRQT